MAHRIGIIGGSGLYDMDGLENVKEIEVETPFGKPSDRLITGQLNGVELVFLPRHGRGHVLTPSEVPYRANIWAMKSLGVNWIISVSAVGSLREEIVPGHVVLVDQFIDRTRARASTFFGKGLVAHVQFGDPVCSTLHGYLQQACEAEGATTHGEGTYVCMEGPAFSTRGESELYRSWGCSVVGMTNIPEAKLAREAEISYATMALATDYDCWYEGHDEVSVESVIAVIQSNVAMARRVLQRVIPVIGAHEGETSSQRALKDAIITNPSMIPEETVQNLAPLVSRYLGER